MRIAEADSRRRFVSKVQGGLNESYNLVSECLSDADHVSAATIFALRKRK